MENSVVRKICFSAMLIVLDILLTAIPRYFEIGPLFSFNRITLGPATVIFASIVVGPLYGGVIGGVSDLLSWIIFPNSGSMLNIFITILYALLGILPYFIFKLFKRDIFKKDPIIYSIFALIFCILTVLLFATNLFDESFVEWGWNLTAAKIIICAICFSLLLASAIGIGMIKRKTKDEEFSSICLTCIICEILLMVLLKPLCFVLYCNIFYGKSILDYFGVSYSFLVILALMFSCAMIPLNTYVVASIKRVTNKFLKEV